MDKLKLIIHNIIITLLFLVISFFSGHYIITVLDAPSIIPSIFVLAVFIIAALTDGYIYGITAALLSVLAVNYAFTFPFFSLNFTINENIISAVILIVVTLSTSTLTTKVKKQEHIKMQAEKEKLRADLLRAVSHDLRTPLTTIYGSSSTLLENYDILSDESKKDILKGIKNDAQWLTGMVENLLSVTRLDQSDVSLKKSAVVVEELVDSVLSKFRKRYPSQHVFLSIPDDFISVSADPLLISQVLLNLLENAVEHAVGMTRLSLTVYTRDKNVFFSVEDDGCGIDKEKLKNIFSGYFMSEKTNPENHKRYMGIGLSVCAAIIYAHNGTITAENIEKGGMRFVFSLSEEASDEQQI